MSVIKIEAKNNRKLRLKEPYHTSCLFRKWEKYANYECTLTPIPNKSIITIEEYYWEQDFQSSFKAYFVETLEKILKEFEEDAIDFEGFAIKVVHNKFHSIDSKPSAYQSSFYDLLYNAIHNGIFEEETTRYETKSPIFELNFPVKVEKLLIDNNLPMVQVFLLQKNSTILELRRPINIRFAIKQRYYYKSIEGDKIHFINACIYPLTTPNQYIHVYFTKNTTLKFHYFIIKQIEQFSKYLYNEFNTSLSSFSIIIDTDSEIEYIDSFTYCNALLWALKNLILDSENVYVK